MISIVKQDRTGYLVVEITGEIDLSTSPQLREAVLELFTERGRKLVISLAGVSHIDSSGMATLVEGLQHARKTEGRLVLAALDEHVRDLFRMTHLDDIFDIADTVDEGGSRLVQA